MTAYIIILLAVFCFAGQFAFTKLYEGMKVLEVSTEEKFLDGNIPRASEHHESLFIQAARKGRPTISTVTVEGKSYRGIEIAGRYYVPDRNEVR